MDVLFSSFGTALPSLISGITLAFIMYAVHKLSGQFSSFKAEHESLLQMHEDMRETQEELKEFQTEIKDLKTGIRDLKHSYNDKFKEIQDELQAQRVSNRNQIKASIVKSCNEAIREQEILPTELETLHRRFESYKELGGNSYICALIDHVDALPLKPEPFTTELMEEYRNV